MRGARLVLAGPHHYTRVRRVAELQHPRPCRGGRKTDLKSWKMYVPVSTPKNTPQYRTQKYT